jgi:hypothetical protein
VIEALKLRSGGRLDLPEGTVYPVLHRLEAAGLLASSAGGARCLTTLRREPTIPRREGVVLARRAGVVLARRAGVVLARRAGVVLARRAGVVLARRAGVLVLVVTGAGIVTHDPYDGAIRGMLEAAACLTGYGLLGGYLGLRRRDGASS